MAKTATAPGCGWVGEENEFVWSPGRGNVKVTGDYIELKKRVNLLEDKCQELWNWVRHIVNEGQVKPMSDLERRVEEFRLLEE